MFDVAILVVSALSGALAAVTGFGIGSLLTPLFASQLDTRLAVAAVAVPHVVGTAVRFFLLSGGVDRKTFVSFGLTSAAGGIAGASLHQAASNRWLTILFGGLLLCAAATEGIGLHGRMRLKGPLAWMAGALSGLLGGLVGNQGGLRSAALLGFGLPKQQFVATATAVALVVDGARLPFYLTAHYQQMRPVWATLGIATTGVVLGTLGGTRVLARIRDVWFHRVLALVLAGLGAAMVVNGAANQ